MKFGMNPSPYYRSKRSTTQIMLELFIGLIAIWVCAIVYYFTLSTSNGINAIVTPIVCMLTAVITECLFMLPKHIKEKGSFKDLLLKLLNSYGYITGLILALLLPVGTSIYASIISTIFAVAVGKMLFGGFGHNIFNPAILGRIFAQTAFLSQMNYDAEISVGATLTTEMGSAGWSLEVLGKEGYSLLDILLGSYRGTLGETFTIAIIVVGIILMIRKVIDWRAPVFYVGTIFVSTLLMGLIGGYGINSFEYALVQISLGGIMFGAIFCITDPVTTPTSPSGRITYAMGAAIVTMLIRYLGSAPEGVAYSILIMNAFTPLIDSSVKGLSNQFTKRKVITTCVMGAVAITSGCIIGANEVNKAGFVNAYSKTYSLATTIKKVKDEGKESTYNVSVSGHLNTNSSVEVVNIEKIYGALLDDYKTEYFKNPNYKDVAWAFVGEERLADGSTEYVLNEKLSSSKYLGIYYVEGEEEKYFKTDFELSMVKSEDETTWIAEDYINDVHYNTKLSTEKYNGVYDINIEDNMLVITFNTDHSASDETAASYVSVQYNVTLNYEEKKIISTEFISCGGGGGYGDILLSENGGDPTKYSEYMANREKAVEFYNKYVKIDSPMDFSEFTKVRYDSFGNIGDYSDDEVVIHVGATYTAIGYMHMMQSVIDYATAEHTIGKVGV